MSANTLQQDCKDMLVYLALPKLTLCSGIQKCNTSTLHILDKLLLLYSIGTQFVSYIQFYTYNRIVVKISIIFFLVVHIN